MSQEVPEAARARRPASPAGSMHQVGTGSAPSGDRDAGLARLGLPALHSAKIGASQAPSHFVPFLLGRWQSWREVSLAPCS